MFADGRMSECKLGFAGDCAHNESDRASDRDSNAADNGAYADHASSGNVACTYGAGAADGAGVCGKICACR